MTARFPRATAGCQGWACWAGDDRNVRQVAARSGPSLPTCGQQTAPPADPLPNRPGRRGWAGSYPSRERIRLQRGRGVLKTRLACPRERARPDQINDMSLHNSLKSGSSLGAKRSVLKRMERVDLLKKRGKWKDGDRVTGLQKTKPPE